MIPFQKAKLFNEIWGQGRRSTRSTSRSGLWFHSGGRGWLDQVSHSKSDGKASACQAHSTTKYNRHHSFESDMPHMPHPVASSQPLQRYKIVWHSDSCCTIEMFPLNYLILDPWPSLARASFSQIQISHQKATSTISDTFKRNLKFHITHGSMNSKAFIVVLLLGLMIGGEIAQAVELREWAPSLPHPIKHSRWLIDWSFHAVIPKSSGGNRWWACTAWRNFMVINFFNKLMDVRDSQLLKRDVHMQFLPTDFPFHAYRHCILLSAPNESTTTC